MEAIKDIHNFQTADKDIGKIFFKCAENVAICWKYKLANSSRSVDSKKDKYKGRHTQAHEKKVTRKCSYEPERSQLHSRESKTNTKILSNIQKCEHKSRITTLG